MNGSGTASRVPGTTAIPNSTIKSAEYNASTDDIYAIFNTPRPIAYGGTNASTAADARTNLGLLPGTDIPGLISNSGLLFGLTLSNNAVDATNDIDIAPGTASSDSTTAPIAMTAASVITKRLDAAWAVGSGNGGLDTGSIANTTYHLWLIQRSDTGVVDALFSTSATSPTMPTNYDRKRRIGSVIRSAGAILAFRQFGDRFYYVTPVLTLNSVTTFATTLATANVPLGITVEALFSSAMSINGSSSANYNVGHAFQGTVTFAAHIMVTGAGNSDSDAAQFSAVTNTSGQIYMSQNVVSGSIFSHTVNTNGWVDTRGKV